MGREVDGRSSRSPARAALALLMLTATASCAGQRATTRPGPPVEAAGTEMTEGSTTTATATADASLVETHAAWRVAGFEQRRFAPERYWEVAGELVETSGGRLRLARVGSSIEGRPINRVDFGRGSTTVLLWSQMHGDESTASRALLDVLAYLAAADDDRLRRIEVATTVTVVPVLNPDGAARFVRHNALGIDVNRDARSRSTPEARALKAVRDSVDADWGFNLHDQSVRTRLGATDRDVRIALLAPPAGPGAATTATAANRRAQRLAGVIADAIAPVVGDAIARYDDSFNPRAFGDLMTRWGTATVLIESGGELSDPDKALLRTANFVAILAALEAIADGSWEAVDSRHYRELPFNGPGIYDLLVRGPAVVLPGRDPVIADIAVNYDDSLARRGGRIVEVGDLAAARALVELDATGLYFVPDPESLADDLGSYLRRGDTLAGVIATAPRGGQVRWRLRDGRVVEDANPQR